MIIISKKSNHKKKKNNDKLVKNLINSICRDSSST